MNAAKINPKKKRRSSGLPSRVSVPPPKPTHVERGLEARIPTHNVEIHKAPEIPGRRAVSLLISQTAKMRNAISINRPILSD
jgi:hypothetical protein